MKRARPKNKKAAMKKLREDELLRNKSRAADEIVSGKQNDEISNINHTAGSDFSRQAVVKKKKSKAGVAAKVILGTLAGLIILAFVAMGFGLFDESQILMPLEDGKINVLLLGVDEEGLRTDAIMLASYNVNEAQVNMISIPRDTKMYIKNRKVTRKINEIHAMSSKVKKGEILGAEATAEAVTQLTGIPINYYVEFSFSAIDRLFDILGPVEFDVPDVEGDGDGMNYDDPVQNLSIHLKPGLQKLSGNQIQQFLRYRKSNSKKGDGSDTGRVERQQAFIKAVVDQKVNPSILLKLPSLLNQLSKEIVTNISASDITKYIRYMNKLSSESIHTYSLPGNTKTISGGSYYVCDIDETKLLLTETFGVDAETAGNITDDITISDEHSQKILKAGNTAKKDKSEAESDGKDDSKATSKPSPSASPASTSTPAPTKAPVVTKSPTKAPVVTKSPSATPEASKTPLEDWDEDFE